MYKNYCLTAVLLKYLWPRAKKNVGVYDLCPNFSTAETALDRGGGVAVKKILSRATFSPRGPNLACLALAAPISRGPFSTFAGHS